METADDEKGRNEKWYVLRVVYSQEMKVKAYLDEHGITNFIPMHYVEKIIKGQAHKVLAPVIHNLIFIRVSPEMMTELKTGHPISPIIRYMMNKEHSTPLVVPDKQMEDFIAVAGSYEEQILYLDPQVANLKEGCRVKVIGGIWEGIEGKFVRIKRGLRVIVSLEGVAAVATASLHPSLVQRID
ncbi:UpxY family transcription antiterminator [uncultured Bacteroides sp.]|uniref:UpxY family transcription antiterminator n=1 Tax=uncultured Bacteroides sp. TaxID=162156 RepID=UPI0026339686|nr:UpxY family transcription antiterminator [uncultured Bacteroides sp.]